MIMIRWEFKPQDLWIGVFWKKQRLSFYDGSISYDWDVWICIVPCLPIHISWTREDKEGRA